MAIIDYLGIENAIKDLLDNDSRTNSFGGKTTTVDGSTPYLTSLRIQIWCYDFSLENLSGATNRDTMLGAVKEVLKENKTLSNNVLYFKFGPGEFDNQKNTAGLGFFKGVSLTIDCEVKE